MKLRDLPPALQRYIVATLLGLIPVGMVLVRQQIPGGQDDFTLFVSLIVFTALFSTWKVELTIPQGKMTLTFAIVCLALLRLGVLPAVILAVLGIFLSTYVRPGQKFWELTRVKVPIHRALFNIANVAIACTVSGMVFFAVRGFRAQGTANPATEIAALTAFAILYFLINSIGVSVAISLHRGDKWLPVWKENFVWTAPGFFACACAAMGVFQADKHFGLWSFLFLPPVWVVYYSFRLYMERVNNDMSHIRELNELNQAVIASLATAIDAKDRNTSSHINRVRHYAMALAKAAGVTGKMLDAVATGALVHDIGKLGIPDHILLKPGKLGPEEFRRIQSHVAIGAEILAPVPFKFPVVDVVLSHHERWDGLGYPNRLKAEAIPIGGRIIAIVDVFDALTSNRPYRRAMTCEEASEVLHEGAGKQFDPQLVGLFLKIISTLWPEMLAMEEAERQRRAEHVRAEDEHGSALVQIGQAAAEMAAACEVAHALAEQNDLDEMVQVVTERALALLPADTVVLYLQEGDPAVLRAVRAEGKYADRLNGMTIQIGEGVSGLVAQSQEAQVNVSAALDVARRFNPGENLDLSAATSVALVHGPEIMGVLTVYTTAYNILSSHHLHVLNILAEHAASAIQNLRRFEQHRELAFTDPLTGLANSRCLFRHLERVLHTLDPEMRTPAEFSLVMLDLDGFKDVNDRLGHLRGDELLRMVAGRLLQLARPDDLICRYAGDEFVLLLPRVGDEQADLVATRVRSAVDSIGMVDGKVSIGASVGVATFPQDGADSRELIHIADTRMYEDKFERRRKVIGRRSTSRSSDTAPTPVGVN